VILLTRICKLLGQVAPSSVNCTVS